jgi:hypothetical protein
VRASRYAKAIIFGKIQFLGSHLSESIPVSSVQLSLCELAEESVAKKAFIPTSEKESPESGKAT